MTGRRNDRHEEFLQLIWKDVGAGRLGSLADYIARFPGLQREIEEEYAAATADRATVSNIEPVLPPMPPPDPDAVPDKIGPYKILEVLGSGGMGIVYLAEQLEPVRRRVALKLIKLGLDTEQVLARFEAERQALALMNHPNIAQVFDSGSADNGRPYFTMEFVPGLPITEYCDKQRLSMGERLKLFAAICRGVQHAHQKGIIHRDIKPTNVLVEHIDRKPVPKIIDFGVAKATNQRLTERSLYTELGHIVGTPEYMSPEQAEMSSLDVDTRTDVYSLGVLLYELSIGALPFDPVELRKAGFLEIQRKIREDEPPRPSTKLTTTGSNAKKVAERRRTDLASLLRQLRGDLDWVTMKALEKDPGRRYQSASELAADVERHLRHEPVEASPPSFVYRLRKFARRFRVQVGAGVAVILTAIAGFVMVSIALHQTGVQRDRAEHERGRAEREKAQVALQRERAEHALADFDLVMNVRRLRDAIIAEKTLYPALPDKLAAMRAWSRLHIARLEAAQRRVKQKLAELDDQAKPVEASATAGDSRAKSESTLHATLEDLLADLQAFFDPDHGLVTRVQRRLEKLEHERIESLENNRAQWAEAIAAIRKSDGVVASRLYQQLEITPQFGLIPLGMDQATKLWEFGHLRSHAHGKRYWRRIGPRKRIRMNGEMGMVFVLIPPGTVWIGAQSRDKSKPNFLENPDYDEHPAHEVTLSAFLLSKFEMTQGQWMRLNDDHNPSFFRPLPPVPFAQLLTRARASEVLLHNQLNAGVFVDFSHPVEQVSWLMCIDSLPRHGLSLPTEAQWEYACRAGTRTTWFTGSTIETLRGYVNLYDAAAERQNRSYLGKPLNWLDDKYPIHAPVGRYAANPWGLHDMIGNVWEWCLDDFKLYKNTHARVEDGLRLGETYIKDNRMARGSSFYTSGQFTHTTWRTNFPAGVALFALGIRPALKVRLD